MTRRDLYAAVLLELAKVAPLAMVVHSGNKSLPGWFLCHGVDERLLRKFFSKAARLGGDTATWSRCQLVRLPLGVRVDGTPQKVLFFNADNVVQS